MGPERAAPAAGPPQLVIGFGNVTERAVQAGIAAVADLLR
jgi:GntR family transcriptional regulator/MocR family aminotransferase